MLQEIIVIMPTKVLKTIKKIRLDEKEAILIRTGIKSHEYCRQLQFCKFFFHSDELNFHRDKLLPYAFHLYNYNYIFIKDMSRPQTNIG